MRWPTEGKDGREFYSTELLSVYLRGRFDPSRPDRHHREGLVVFPVAVGLFRAPNGAVGFALRHKSSSILIRTRGLFRQPPSGVAAGAARLTAIHVGRPAIFLRNCVSC